MDRVGKDYDYMQGAGTSGLGWDYSNRNGFGGLGGYGGSGYGATYGLESSCPEGVNQNTALLATAAAIAVGAGVIYRAVTLQQAGRRKKREDEGPTGVGIQDKLMDLIALGNQRNCETFFPHLYHMLCLICM